jgi:hypothetical protein
MTTGRTLLWHVVAIDAIDGIKNAAEDVAVAGYVVTAVRSRWAVAGCELDTSLLAHFDEVAEVLLVLGWVAMNRSTMSWRMLSGSVLSWGVVDWSLRDRITVNCYSLLS